MGKANAKIINDCFTMRNVQIQSWLIALSFYFTLPIFNVFSQYYFNDAWVFNKVSILVMSTLFIINLPWVIKNKGRRFFYISFTILFVLLYSYIVPLIYGFNINVKVNNTHILILFVFFSYFVLSRNSFDISKLIFKPIFIISFPVAVLYFVNPHYIQQISTGITNLIGTNSVLVDREFRFSGFFSEPSKLAVFSGIAFFFYMDKHQRFMSLVSLFYLCLSMSKFAIIFVPLCILLSLILKSFSLLSRSLIIFSFIILFLLMLLNYNDLFQLLYHFVNYESLNTYETRFGFPIIAIMNLPYFPIGIGIFDGYRFILLDGEYTISNYCNALLQLGGNCYEMSSYSYESLADFFPKDLLSTLCYYFGFIGLILFFIIAYQVVKKISIRKYRFTFLYIFLCLFFVTSYDYMIIILTMMILHDGESNEGSEKMVETC